MINISLSIVTYNNKVVDVKKLINESFRISLDFKFYLIDNSESELLQNLNTNENKILYIFNNKNLGYGAAHNIAICDAIKRGSSPELVGKSTIERNRPATIIFTR